MCVSLTNDKKIREVLKWHLEEENGSGKIVEEMGINHGSVRIDIAVIDEAELHGYEIKSDLDTLKRLPKQAQKYNTVFDKITLVVGKNHLLNAMHIIPDWWGIKVAVPHNSTLRLRTIREPEHNNNEQKSVSVARILWKEEALYALEQKNNADGVRSKRREDIYQRLSETMGLDDLKNLVRTQCRIREDWRPVVQ